MFPASQPHSNGATAVDDHHLPGHEGRRGGGKVDRSPGDFVRQAGSADKRAIVYARFYHEVFNEAERERPLADLADWLDERCP